MQRVRKIVLISASVLVGLIVLLVVGLKLYLTDERLRGMIEPAAESALGRDVSIGRFEARLIRSFPDLSVGAEELVIHTPGTDQGNRPDLASIERIWIDLSLLPLLQGRVHVNSLSLEQPKVLIEVYDDLSTNLIALGGPTSDKDPSETDSSDEGESGAVIHEIAIEHFSIVDGQLAYSHADGTLLTVASLNGNLSARVGGITNGETTYRVGDVDYVVNTAHENDLVGIEGMILSGNTYYETGGIPYVDGWDLSLNLNALASLDSSWIRLVNAEVGMESVLLSLKGSIANWDEERIGVDLELEAPDASIEGFWSLLPASIVKDIEGVSGRGDVTISAKINGDIAEAELPAVDARLEVVGGSVSYPDLPSPINDINVDAILSLEKLTLNQFTASANGAQLDMKGSVENFTAPTFMIDVALLADLDAIPSYYPLEAGTSLSGKLTMDVQVAGGLDAPEGIKTDGVVNLQDVNYSSALLEQPVENLSGDIRLEKQVIALEDLRFNTGTSDVTFNGTIENVASLMVDSVDAGQEATIRGHVTSKYLNISEQIAEDSTATGPLVLPDVVAEISFDAEALDYEGIVLKESDGSIDMRDGIVNFEGGSNGFLEGILRTTGSFDLSNPLQPMFEGSFGLEKVRASQFFTAFETLDHVAQLGSFLDGFFDSKASIGLRMDEALNPLLETLLAEGTFGAQSSSLTGMPIQKKLAALTGISSMEALAVGEWTHSFSISGEKLHIQALDLTAGDFTFGVNGTQGFDGSLDYMLRVDLPESAAETLSKSPLQEALGQVTQIASAALVDPETKRITLDFQAGGTFLAPSIKLNSGMLKSRFEARTNALVAGAKEEAQAKLDSLENAARLKAEAELAAQRKKLEEEAKNKAGKLLGVDSDSSNTSSSIDSLKEKGGEVLKDRLKGLLNRKKKKN